MESKKNPTARIKAVAGLGNEGQEYLKTYHNVGAFVVARIKSVEIAAERKYFSLSGFMNTIGVPVKRFAGLAGASSGELLVIHDETDLPVGEYRLSFGGGSAGHKGVQSVIDNLGTSDFWRLRIGVRDPQEQSRRKAEAFVLQEWSASDEKMFTEVSDKALVELSAKGLF